MKGITETFVLPGSRGISVQVTVEETIDQAAETSDVRISVNVVSDTYAGHIYYLTGAVEADGTTLQMMDAYMGSHYVYVQKLHEGYPIQTDSTSYSGSPWNLYNIPHETDGSKKITITIDLTGDQLNGWGADGWQVKGSKEVALTRFSKASTVAATDSAVGAVSMVAINRASTDYTHSLEYTFGALHGYVSAQGLAEEEVIFGDAGVSFRIPETFYGQIPNDKSGSCTLTCRTYYRNALVGDPQSTTFTVVTEEGVCAPLVEASVQDVNPLTLALTGDGNVLVRYISHAECTIHATARKQAVIAGQYIAGRACPENTLTIMGVETDTIRFSAVDSRGYSTAVSLEKAMIPYIHLTCNPDCKRTDPTSGGVKLTVSGDYFQGAFGATANTLTLRYRIDGGSWQDLPATVEADTYTAQAVLTGMDYAKAYTVQVQAADRLQRVEKTVLVGKGIPVFDWGEQDFTFHVPVYLLGGGIRNQDGSTMYAPATESSLYPGCYYRTTEGQTEWINPPMVVGENYRTTQRWNGQAVYRKLVNCGKIQKQMYVTTGEENIRIISANVTVFGRLVDAQSVTYWIDMVRVGIQAGDAMVTAGDEVYTEFVYVYR